jgi:hypothetical protein
MNDDIVKMAKAAGIAKHGLGWTCWEGQLERFAALAAAAERERIAAWVEDMCVGLDAKTIANGIMNGGNDDIRAFEVRK